MPTKQQTKLARGDSWSERLGIQERPGMRQKALETIGWERLAGGVESGGS